MCEERIGKFSCPKCGNTGADASKPIRFVETIECHRRVFGVHGGALYVDGFYEAGGEGYDEPTPAQVASRVFECHGEPDGPSSWCGHRWPVLPWVYQAIEWDALIVWCAPCGSPHAPAAPGCRARPR